MPFWYIFGDCVYAYMCLVLDTGDHHVAEAIVCVAREMSRVVFVVAGIRVPNILRNID